MNIIKIMRAIPGAGKSTLAKKFAATNPNHIICSADDFHYFGLEKTVENYKFDFNNQYQAHKTCQDKFVDAIKNNTSLIIIDNTNIKSKDYRFYFLKGIESNYEVEFHTILNGTADQYFNSNVHRVPLNIIENMIQNFKPVQNLINDYPTKEIFYDFNELRKESK